jgi:epsilon-lactone hydrolase
MSSVSHYNVIIKQKYHIAWVQLSLSFITLALPRKDLSMPSLTSRIVAFILRTSGVFKKQFSGGPDFPKYQAKALAVPIAPAAKLSKSCRVSQSQFQGRDVWEFSPKDRDPSATILYWHGGGYVYPPGPPHWSFMARMAQTHGWTVVAPCYKLAPMAEVGEVTGFAVDLWRDLLARSAGPLMMGGDSAGGGLAAATAMLIRDTGLSPPSKLILICPWVDIEAAHPDQVGIEPRDAILTLRGVREAGALYAGAAGSRDPRVSPIHGSWDNLPPILMFGGGDDILVTDARAVKAKVPSSDYHELAGMIHDWPIFTFPESRAAQAQMAQFATT